MIVEKLKGMLGSARLKTVSSKSLKEFGNIRRKVWSDEGLVCSSIIWHLAGQ